MWNFLVHSHSALLCGINKKTFLSAEYRGFEVLLIQCSIITIKKAQKHNRLCSQNATTRHLHDITSCIITLKSKITIRKLHLGNIKTLKIDDLVCIHYDFGGYYIIYRKAALIGVYTCIYDINIHDISSSFWMQIHLSICNAPHCHAYLNKMCKLTMVI